MPKENGERPTFFSKLISRFHQKKPGDEQDASLKDQNAGMPDLKLIFFIVDWNRSDVVSRVFEESGVRFFFINRGKGTASSEILDLLGIGASDKAVILCLEEKRMMLNLIKAVREKLGYYNVGAGISFSVPLSGINAPILRLFKKLDTERIKEEKADKPRTGAAHSNTLIIAIVNKGSGGVFMNTARGAGAKGGTVLNARSRDNDGAVKVFGISVQDEKEVIFILTGGDKKDSIVKALFDAHGPDTKTRALIMSLPVDSVITLSRG